MSNMTGATARKRHSARALALRKLRAEPGAFLTAGDLHGVTLAAASKALGRLAREGLLQRVRKGLYYAPRETLIGKSRPSEPAVTQKVIARKGRPTGVTAANLLGMSTQIAARPEFALYTTARPRGAEGARLHLRPRARAQELETQDAALLEFLRDRGRYGELDAEQTCARACAILTEARPARLRCLREAALGEPPRVRAILGALMESAGLPESLWRPLRKSLNSLSRFDFGLFRALPNAKEWQAK